MATFMGIGVSLFIWVSMAMASWPQVTCKYIVFPNVKTTVLRWQVHCILCIPVFLNGGMHLFVPSLSYEPNWNCGIICFPHLSVVFPLLAFCVLLCACLQCVDVGACRVAKLTLVTCYYLLRQGHSLNSELANSSLLAHSQDCLCLPASQVLGFQVTFQSSCPVLIWPGQVSLYLLGPSPQCHPPLLVGQQTRRVLVSFLLGTEYQLRVV